MPPICRSPSKINFPFTFVGFDYPLFLALLLFFVESNLGKCKFISPEWACGWNVAREAA
jgi:hypothetical protein